MMESLTWLVVIGFVLMVLYASFWYKVHGYRRYVKSNVSLKGKTVVITGANSGLGKETAVDLARRGALVILACRNPRKAEDAAREIRTRSGNHDVLCRWLDLSILASVRHFVDTFEKEEHGVDILINNAGVGMAPGETTADGFDMVFGTNHFGHFLLTNLLLDKLKDCAPSRVITVSSASERFVNTMDFSSAPINGVRYPGLAKYMTSKAANIMFTRELARRLKCTGVTCYSLRPGVTYTNIFSNVFGQTVTWLLTPIFWLMMISEATGAQTTIFCAVDDTIMNKSGQLFDNCREGTIRSPVAKTDKMDQKLWEISCQAVGIEMSS